MRHALKRRVGRRAKPSPLGGTDVFAWSDFTYLGAFRVPREPIAGAESFYGDGLMFSEEASDVGATKHLISTAYVSSPNHLLYEYRIATPLYPEGHTMIADYNLATVVKQYGNVYGSPTKKKVMYNPGTGCESTPFTVHLDGALGLHKHTDGKVYATYGFGYSACLSWCLLRITLDYGAGTGMTEGPWGFSDQSWKAMMHGCISVPSAFATTYLGGRDLLAVGGGYRSLVQSCDTAMGGNATAFSSTGLGAEDSYGTSLACMGSWPFSDTPGVGKNRWPRPENATANAVDNWGLDKFSWNDRVSGMVWPQGHPTKRGILCFGSTGRGRQQYLSSQLPPSRQGHWRAIVDPNKFTPVSGIPRYDVMPESIELYQWPTIDYTQIQYAGGPNKSVSSIVSTGGALQTSDTGCTVNCTGHGYAVGDYVEIEGASLSEYNELWDIPPGGIINANSFYIRNTSKGSVTWSGNSPSGTIVVRKVVNAVDRVLGCTDDPVARRVYVKVAVAQGVNNIDGHAMVHVLAY